MRGSTVATMPALIVISAGMAFLGSATVVGLVRRLSFAPPRRIVVLVAAVNISLDIGLTLRLESLHSAWLLPAWWCFVAVGLSLSLIDAREHRLPDVVVGPSYPVLAGLLLIAAAGTGDWAALVRSAEAAMACFAGFFALAAIAPSGLGFGDVKLAGVIGAMVGYLSWPTVFTAVLLAYIGGAGYAGGMVLFRRGTLKTAIPFGPFLVAGSVVSALVGGLR
jgi:leader peptidase (prepilin peptidase)/N-methyltransferase